MPNQAEFVICYQTIDSTYIRLGQGFVYLPLIMDVFSRAIRGWNLSRILDAGLTLIALRDALTLCIPQMHHSDQGIHYAAKEYVDLLNHYHVQISMAARGKPEENGYAERLMRTIKEEEVDLSEYNDFADARRQIGRFIEDVYMTKRIHSALGYLTPTEYEAAWRGQITPEESPKNCPDSWLFRNFRAGRRAKHEFGPKRRPSTRI